MSQNTPTKRYPHRFFVAYVVKTAVDLNGVTLYNNDFRDSNVSVEGANERSVEHFERLRAAVVEKETELGRSGKYEVVILNSKWLHADF